MAYRIEQEPGGIQALVIDGWEKGIADSPYLGIASMKNVNSSWLPGAVYVNYKRTSQTFTGGTPSKPKYYTQSGGTSPTYYFIDDKGQIWYGGYSGWTLLTGNHTASSGLGQGIIYWRNYLFVFGPTYIDVCGDGTGPGAITSSNWANVNSSGYWVKNLVGTDLPNYPNNLTTAPSAGDTTLTLNFTWPYITGSYEVNINAGEQYITGAFTYGSATVTLTGTIQKTTSSKIIAVNITPRASAYEHMAIVGYNDTIYFCNGITVGSITAPLNVSTSISASTGNTTVNFMAVPLPTTDVANWLELLSNNLLIGGNNAVYPFGYLNSPQPITYDTPFPMKENVSKMINILNTVYLFAGNKGNIYLTNGYQVTLFKKIPDSFLGKIDPNWMIGGVMFHRNKLFFGAFGTDGSSTRLCGIFSLVLSGGSTQYSLESSGAITFESQNSYGITPTNSNDATGILIDLNTQVITSSSSSQPDTYISAWYNNSAGGADTNTTTGWDNYEASVESDLIPIGTFLQKRTFENIEYKLDQPLAEGDSIRLSYRTQYSGSYTSVGASAVTGGAGVTTATSNTATQVVSDTFNSEIQNAQWVQLKAEFKCASSGSSYIRLREIRLH